MSLVTTYGVLDSARCKWYTKDVQVMKCSTRAYDYIYKVVDPNTSADFVCGEGFCGMI